MTGISKIEDLPSQEKQPAIVLFDGVCNFCNASVQFILRRDPKAYFRFAPLQSPPGEQLLRQHGLASSQMNSLVLIEGGKAYACSTAVLRICRHLSGLWPMCYAFIILPAFLRDALYRWIARNRYRWFGRRESCMILTAGQRERFLGF